jgi:hypothetical protein
MGDNKEDWTRERNQKLEEIKSLWVQLNLAKDRPSNIEKCGQLYNSIVNILGMVSEIVGPKVMDECKEKYDHAAEWSRATTKANLLDNRILTLQCFRFNVKYDKLKGQIRPYDRPLLPGYSLAKDASDGVGRMMVARDYVKRLYNEMMMMTGGSRAPPRPPSEKIQGEEEQGQEGEEEDPDATTCTQGHGASQSDDFLWGKKAQEWNAKFRDHLDLAQTLNYNIFKMIRGDSRPGAMERDDLLLEINSEHLRNNLREMLKDIAEIASPDQLRRWIEDTPIGSWYTQTPLWGGTLDRVLDDLRRNVYYAPLRGGWDGRTEIGIAVAHLKRACDEVKLAIKENDLQLLNRPNRPYNAISWSVGPARNRGGCSVRYIQ